MASRKKQEDQNLKKLRELVTQPHNKKCFDCTQRGPTYVNMTIGAFVCTSCSGLLRGLNPPHRIKSISMASFNDQEIEFLEKHGNEVCQRTWYALWPNPIPPEPESREEQKVKDFLATKYERKKWYSSKPKVTPQEPEAKPLKTLLGENVPQIVVSKKQSQEEKSPVFLKTTSVISQPTQEKPAPKTNMDLLGDLGPDTFAPPHVANGFTPFTNPPPSENQQNFFSAFDNNSNTNQSNSFDLFANQASSSVNSQQQNNLFSNPSNVSSFQQNPGTAEPTDKYAALSDLSLFKTSATQSVFSGNSVFNMDTTSSLNPQPNNTQPNPFMSPGTSSSGAAVFQQQQQKPSNPFQTNSQTNVFGSNTGQFGASQQNNMNTNWPAQNNMVNNTNNNFMSMTSDFQQNKPNQNFNMFNANSNQFSANQTLQGQNFQGNPTLQGQNFPGNNFSNQNFSTQFNQAPQPQQQFGSNQFNAMNSSQFSMGGFPQKQSNFMSTATNQQLQQFQSQPSNQYSSTPPAQMNQFSNFSSPAQQNQFGSQTQGFTGFNTQQSASVKNPPFGGVQLPGFGAPPAAPQQSFGTWGQEV